MGWASVNDYYKYDDGLKKKKFPDEDEEEDDEDYGSEVSGHTSRHAPDGGWAWLILFAAFLLNLIVDGIGFSYGTAQPEYMEIFNATFSEVSLVGSTLTGSYLVVGPIVGAMCLRFGLRKVTILGSVIAMVGFVLSSFATSLNMLVITYGLLGGIGLGMMYLPSIVCVSYWFEKKLGIATGIAVCGSGLGQFLFPPLGEYLMSEYQWQGKHLILGGIVLHGAVCGFIFRLPEYRRHYKQPGHRRQRVEIKQGVIMKALIEDKKRQRTISEGSLDNCVITTNNRLIKLEPSLFHCKNNQALSSMLRRLGYSIQSLAVSKSSLQPSNQCSLMEALQNGSPVSNTAGTAAAISPLAAKTNSSQVLLPLSKRNSSPDFNKVVSPSSLMADQQQPLLDGVAAAGGANVIRSNSVKSSCDANGECVMYNVSNGIKSPVKTFPKTRSCDALAQEQPYNMLLKKLVSERVRSSSECAASTTHSSVNLPMHSLGSSPALPVGSLDISIQEIPTTDAVGSSYTSNTSLATDISSQFTREYVPNSSQNFVTTCMISGHQLEASIRELNRQEMRDKSYLYRIWYAVMDMLKLLCCPVFTLFLLSSLFTLLAFYIPYYYVQNLGLDIGMERFDAEFLPVIISITSTVGRLIVGWLGDRPWINALYLNNGSLIFAGICSIILPFLKTAELLCVATAILGFCLAVFVALRTVLLVKFLGVDLIPKSFGLMCLIQGIAAFTGNPLAGKLADTTGSLDFTFYVAGIFTIIAGVILFPLGYLKRREDRILAVREAEEETDDYMMQSTTGMASPEHCRV